MNQTDVRERERESSSTSQTHDSMRGLRIAFLVTLVLLVLQYVLGMIANLDVQLPNGNAWGWVFTNSFLIQLHIYNGTLLIVMGLVTLILSIVALHTAGIIASVVGLVLLIFTWLSGAQFLATGDNGLSLRMAIGFMGAFIAYLLGYYLSRPRSQKPSM